MIACDLGSSTAGYVCPSSATGPRPTDRRRRAGSWSPTRGSSGPLPSRSVILATMAPAQSASRRARSCESTAISAVRAPTRRRRRRGEPGSPARRPTPAASGECDPTGGSRRCPRRAGVFSHEASASTAHGLRLPERGRRRRLLLPLRHCQRGDLSRHARGRLRGTRASAASPSTPARRRRPTSQEVAGWRRDDQGAGDDRRRPGRSRVARRLRSRDARALIPGGLFRWAMRAQSLAPRPLRLRVAERLYRPRD